MADRLVTPAADRIVGLDDLAPQHRPRPATAALRSQAVERVVATMRDQLDQPMPLEAMANVAALSLYHFSRVFHNVTGLPPARFLNALRLAEAKRLLLTTSMSVTDVCYQVGYNSLGSFTVRFTQSVGLPPGRFRRLRRSHRPTDAARRLALGSDLRASPPGTGEVSGQVHASTELSQPVFVGLFTTPIPEGQPVCCTVLPCPDRYRISGVPDGTYHVFAACFPRCGDGLALLLPDDGSLQVGAAAGAVRVSHGSAAHDRDLWLHPVQPTDPPILVVLPSAPPDTRMSATP
jgi:AraC family transcriptional regulator